jgi:hypothetical protein
MIQPTYGHQEANRNYISPAYGVSSAVLCGLTLSLNTINSIQIANGRKKDTAPALGIGLGIAQIVLGVATMPEEQYSDPYNYTNESKKALSFVNIGLGTTSVILGSINLFSGNKRSDKKTTWNFYSYPSSPNTVGLAVCMTRKL